MVRFIQKGGTYFYLNFQIICMALFFYLTEILQIVLLFRKLETTRKKLEISLLFWRSTGYKRGKNARLFRLHFFLFLAMLDIKPNEVLQVFSDEENRSNDAVYKFEITF